MNIRVLIVEDEVNIREVCTRYLEREGYEVCNCHDGESSWKKFQQFAPHLVILDLMLPKKDGCQLCQEIRAQSDIPIIMLTARGEEHDHILGLTLGADDYVTKPFSPRELLLRVQNILRRTLQQQTKPEKPTTDRLVFQTLTINSRNRTVTVGDQTTNLTVKEFDLLHLLARHPYQVFSRMELLELIWESQYTADGNVVTVLVSRLREKLMQYESQYRWIQTVWGIGYRCHADGREDK